MILVDDLELNSYFYEDVKLSTNVMYIISCLQNAGWEEIIITSFEKISIDKESVYSKRVARKKNKQKLEYISNYYLKPSFIINERFDPENGNLFNELSLFFFNRFFLNSFSSYHPKLQLVQRKIETEEICKNSDEEIKRPKTYIAKNIKEIEKIARGLFSEGKEFLIAKSSRGARAEEVYLLTPCNLERVLKDIEKIKNKEFVVQEYFCKVNENKIILYPRLRLHVAVYSWNPLQYEIFSSKIVCSLEPIDKSSLNKESFNFSKLFKLFPNYSLSKDYIPSKGGCLEEFEQSLTLKVKNVLYAIAKSFETNNNFVSNLTPYLGFDFLIIDDDKKIDLEFLEIEDSPALVPTHEKAKHLFKEHENNLISYYRNIKNLSDCNKMVSKLSFKKEKPENLYFIKKAKAYLELKDKNSLEKACGFFENALDNESNLSKELMELVFYQSVIKASSQEKKCINPFIKGLYYIPLEEVENLNLIFMRYLNNSLEEFCEIVCSRKNWEQFITFMKDSLHKNFEIMELNCKRFFLNCLSRLNNLNHQNDLEKLICIHAGLSKGFFDFKDIENRLSLDSKKTLETVIKRLYLNILTGDEIDILNLLKIELMISRYETFDLSENVDVTIEQLFLVEKLNCQAFLDIISYLELDSNSKKSSIKLSLIYFSYAMFLFQKGDVMSLHKALKYFSRIKGDDKNFKLAEKYISTCCLLLAEKWKFGSEGFQDNAIAEHYQNLSRNDEAKMDWVRGEY